MSGRESVVPVEPTTAPSLDAVVRPWRTATVVASAIAALELLLLVVASVALLGKPLAHSLRDAAVDRALEPMKPVRRQPQRLPATPPKLARSETSVLVLNGNGRTGAAAAEAQRVRARGYAIGGVGNAVRSDYTRSVVMYRSRYRAEALRLARDLRIQLVGPLDGLRPGALRGAHLALVVGS